MGRPVPSFRIALEGEMAGWKEYRRSLKSIDSKESLDSMFDQARSNCMAAGNAVRPVVFEGMFMAIAFSHERRFVNLERAIETLRLEMNRGENQDNREFRFVRSSKKYSRSIARLVTPSSRIGKAIDPMQTRIVQRIPLRVTLSHRDVESLGPSMPPVHGNPPVPYAGSNNLIRSYKPTV